MAKRAFELMGANEKKKNDTGKEEEEKDKEKKEDTWTPEKEQGERKFDLSCICLLPAARDRAGGRMTGTPIFSNPPGFFFTFAGSGRMRRRRILWEEENWQSFG